MLMAGIFATALLTAVVNPIVAYNWHKKGKKVWKYFSHLGTTYSLGDRFYLLLRLNDPSDKGAKLRSRPKIETFKTMSLSSADQGCTLESDYDCVVGHVENYADYYYNLLRVTWDTDAEEYRDM